VENMLWIGKSSAELLKQHNIQTISDIAKDENKVLLEQLLDKN
jgi:nucleotidyltransferase/DNA polymerase involved in DNA repair